MIGYITHNQSMPTSETDCIELDFYTAKRHDWSTTPIFYYSFDLDDGIYVYHPEKSNPNYKL